MQVGRYTTTVATPRAGGRPLDVFVRLSYPAPDREHRGGRAAPLLLRTGWRLVENAPPGQHICWACLPRNRQLPALASLGLQARNFGYSPASWRWREPIQRRRWWFRQATAPVMAATTDAHAAY